MPRSTTTTSGTGGSTRRRTLYLVDGHAQFFRAYYAIRNAMSSPVTHEPTNMTFGFTGMLLKVLREYRPDYLAVVIDAAGDRETFRSEIYPEYKANREAPPDDFGPQVQRCLDLLEKFHVPVIAEEGVEADDAIASLVQRLRREHPELDIRIVSKDKDLAQLVDGRVQLIDVHTDRTVGPEDIFKTEGVKPGHVVDILALMGDTVDNVPGVPGIGPKTAAKLILQYGSLDNLLQHIDEIKGKRRENLEAAAAALPLSRTLVQLRDDLDVPFDLDEARADPRKLDVEALMRAFNELGFSRLRDELRQLAGGGDGAAEHVAEMDVGQADAPVARAPARAAGRAEEPGLFDGVGGVGAAEEALVSTDASLYDTITTRAGLRDLVKRLSSSSAFAIDTETSHLAPLTADLCGVSISLEPCTGVYIPICSPQPESHLDLETVLDALRPVLEDVSIEKIGHNLKFDLNVLRRHGVALRGRLFDTMIADYVVEATRSSHSLDALALALLRYTCRPIADLIGRGRKQITFDQVPLEQAGPYAAEDADITLRLHEVLEPQLERMGLDDLFDAVEMPLVPVLAELEYNGIRVDPDQLDRQREKLMHRIDSLRDQISDAAPHPFSPDSPKQLAAVLFNKPDADPPGLGLRPLRRGKTGPSTDQEVLEKLAANPDIDSDLPARILEYRQLTKLVSTYLIALKEAINARTGRVHASFNQTVAVTGRLSSSDPNLQNIPIRTDVGREIRRAFVAEPGNVLITADYSQIELRMLAHLSGDEALIEAFNSGQDIHTAVAAEVFDVVPAEVTPEQRTAAKMVNFGIVYGVTPYGLARRLGPDYDVDRAKRIITDYKTRFGRINAFLHDCIAMAEARGYVETILKRRRAIPQINARNRQMRGLGERLAINTVVQGSAADLIKLAMIDLYRRLPDAFPVVRMVLQIHDELVFEAPEDRADDVAAFVTERMEQAMDLDVPLVVESAWSHNWIDAK